MTLLALQTKRHQEDIREKTAALLQQRDTELRALKETINTTTSSAAQQIQKTIQDYTQLIATQVQVSKSRCWFWFELTNWKDKKILQEKYEALQETCEAFEKASKMVGDKDREFQKEKQRNAERVATLNEEISKLNQQLKSTKSELADQHEAVHVSH